MGVGVVLRRQAVLLRETVEVRHPRAVDHVGIVVVLLGHDEDVPGPRHASTSGRQAGFAGTDQSQRNERQTAMRQPHG